ncbi:MAG: preprotein translocase subunit YajC [Candidatus Omnitrophota bacterium]
MNQPQVNPLLHIIPLVLIFMVFYFLLIKPQKDRQTEHKNLIKNLKKNDEVITAGGIHATVVNVKDTTVILRIDDNTRVEVEKDYIVSVRKSA